ncbi:MAG: lactonase family protein [Bacteroidales bacterium]|nr:lactonase family protein [Candidatus Cacconaster merdequi]
MSLVCSVILQMLVGAYGGQMYSLNIDSVTSELLGCDTIFVENASYVALSGDGSHFFTVSESGDNSKISSFSISAPYGLVSQVDAPSADPCFLMYRPAARPDRRSAVDAFLLTADYSGGSISVFPVAGNVVKPVSQVVSFHCKGQDPVRQPSSHIHQLKVFGKYLLASDLGGDMIHILGMSERKGSLHLDTLSDIRLAPGSGPRHMELSKDGKFLYVLTELSNEIYVYSLSCNNALNAVELQRLPIGDPDEEVISHNPLEEGVNTQAAGDIHLHPNGKFLYASLRNGADKIAVFDVARDGRITPKGACATARHPRNFAIMPDGCTIVVPCKNSDLIQFLKIDSATGIPADSGKSINITCPVLTVSVH